MKIYVVLDAMREKETGKVHTELIGIFSNEEDCENCQRDTIEYMEKYHPEMENRVFYARRELDRYPVYPS